MATGIGRQSGQVPVRSTGRFSDRSARGGRTDRRAVHGRVGAVDRRVPVGAPTSGARAAFTGPKPKTKSAGPTALNWKGSVWFFVGAAMCVGGAIWQIVDPHDPSEESGRRSFITALLSGAYKIGGQIGVVSALFVLALICLGLAWHTLKSEPHEG
ncbi:MAG: hypothetical protein QM770_00860 [Tepidisphaeraceae bacterium]